MPDHSTFSKNRHGRFRDSDLLRRLFEQVVRRCMDERLVGGEGFAVDASLIKADASRQTCVRTAEGLPAEVAGRRAVKEYLATVDDAAFGAASPIEPKLLAPADPACRWTGADGGLAYFAYCTNHLIDLENAVIVDVEASTAVRQAEVTAAKTMIERTAETFDLRPKRLAADTGYGSAETLAWLVDERGIEPHIPVWDKSTRKDGTFSRSDFAYNQDDDVYTCPAGKSARKRQRKLSERWAATPPPTTVNYRAARRDCEACPLKSQCCPHEPVRRLQRSIHEAARDKARAIATTEAYVVSRRQRKKIEMLFAHLKRILKLDRLRLRGPNGARDEFLLAATAQNLRRLAKLIPLASPLPAT